VQSPVLSASGNWPSPRPPGRLEQRAARAYSIPAIFARKAVDRHAIAHRQIETPRIGGEIIGHLVLGGKGTGGRGKRHAVKTVELRRGEQAQRSQRGPPGIADLCIGIQDHKSMPRRAR